MTQVYLVQAPLRLRSFTRWALDRRYLSVPPGDGRGRPREPDLGYALHAALTGLFGEHAPRPFTLPPDRGGRHGSRLGGRGTDVVPVLGYAKADQRRLAALASLAREDSRQIFDCDALRVKPLPANWPAGMRLGFELRACPVSRRLAKRPFTTNMSSPANRQVLYSQRGREVDAYQLATARAGECGDPMPRRDEVYAAWLRERFAGSRDRPPAFSLVAGSIRVQSFRSTRLLRRPHDGNGRSARWLTRPEVWFSGEIEIADGGRVAESLLTGIGRHSGFGFGMLLLRPA
ncbi:MAG: type I-E CRISPR-associated protein Cas6/Cse3/CasE [Chloroflexota bacterium]|nr:type I-E CRISPR-associated protein Cas6/Cse3/CasE [Chloroflexota bacterium]